MAAVEGVSVGVPGGSTAHVQQRGPCPVSSDSDWPPRRTTQVRPPPSHPQKPGETHRRGEEPGRRTQTNCRRSGAGELAARPHLSSRQVLRPPAEQRELSFPGPVPVPATGERPEGRDAEKAAPQGPPEAQLEQSEQRDAAVGQPGPCHLRRVKEPSVPSPSSQVSHRDVT